MYKRVLAIVAVVCALTAVFTLRNVAQGQQASGSQGFGDTIRILPWNMTNAPISLIYQNNNGVNISGPATVAPAAPPNNVFQVAITSNNEDEAGSPDMVLSYNGQVCMLVFKDETLQPLFVQGTVGCEHFTLGSLVPDVKPSVYNYTIAYHP